MTNVTDRVSAAQYKQMISGRSVSKIKPPGSTRTKKYRNRTTVTKGGELFDSAKEARTAANFEIAKSAVDAAQRVVNVERQKAFLLVPKQDGERASSYISDFVVTFADGHIEVIDTKSPVTRKLPVYVLKRKLMLQVHGIRIREA